MFFALKYLSKIGIFGKMSVKLVNSSKCIANAGSRPGFSSISDNLYLPATDSTNLLIVLGNPPERAIIFSFSSRMLRGLREPSKPIFQVSF